MNLLAKALIYDALLLYYLFHLGFAIPHQISFLRNEEYEECIFLFLGVLGNEILFLGDPRGFEE
jgi:hypothetical protein